MACREVPALGVEGTDFENQLGTGSEAGLGEEWKFGPAYAFVGVLNTPLVGDGGKPLDSSLLEEKVGES